MEKVKAYKDEYSFGVVVEFGDLEAADKDKCSCGCGGAGAGEGA